MSTSSVTGSGSIINVAGIVNNLMQVEQRPLSAINDKINTANVSISAMSDLKSMVDSTYSAVSALENPLLFGAKTAAVTDSALAKVSVVDSSAANVGAISISALKLAEVQRTKLSLPNAQTPDSVLEPLNGGALQITVPQDSTLLAEADRATGFDPGVIDTSGMTLAQVRDRINEDFKGKLRADLVNTGVGTTPWVLVLTGAQTGSSASFNVSYESAAVSAFQPAQSAEALIGGITVKSETNVFKEAVPGVRVELLKARTMNGVTASAEVGAVLTVSDNKTEITSKVNALASSFSALVQKIRTLSAPGSNTTKPGPLASNAGVLGLSSGVMSAYSLGFRLSTPGVVTETDGRALGQTVDVSGVSYTQLSWAQLGLELGRDGNVTLDSARLNEALSGKVGEAMVGGFTSNLKSVLDSFRGVSGSIQNVLENMKSNVNSLKSDAEKAQARIDRLRTTYTAKYAALDSKLVSMRQQSSNVQSALAGLRA